MAKDNPIHYAGYYYDEETKNYYLQARYYNPENGAFLALDPHPGDEDEPMSQNGYTYGNNNPVMHVDINGQYAIPLASVVLIPGVGWLTVAAIGAVVGGAWLVVRYGIPWAKRKYSNWYFAQKHINGWNVRVEQHGGKVHAHWKKGGRKGSVAKDGKRHHKGESYKPPKEIKDFLRRRGFKV